MVPRFHCIMTNRTRLCLLSVYDVRISLSCDKQNKIVPVISLWCHISVFWQTEQDCACCQFMMSRFVCIVTNRTRLCLLSVYDVKISPSCDKQNKIVPAVSLWCQDFTVLWQTEQSLSCYFWRPVSRNPCGHPARFENQDDLCTLAFGE